MLFHRLFSFVGRHAQYHKPHAQFVRLLLVTAIALFAVLTPQTVFASQPVDPSTLNPPPPPEFNPVCQAVGGGTRCDIGYTETQGPYGTGIICGTGATSFEVVVFDTRTVNGFRVYDQNGNLIQRHFREDLVGTFSNPLTGALVDFVQSDTVIHTLSVPGDINSGTFTSSGVTRVFMPSSGVVLIDAGTALILESDGTTITESAHHPFAAYYEQGDTSAIQPICDALQ